MNAFALRTLQVLACGITLGLPATAASFVNTYPDWVGDATGGYIKEAQTFSVASASILTSFQFKMYPAAGQAAQLHIFVWDASSGPIGASLYDSQYFFLPNSFTDNLVNMSVSLTPGTLYGAVIDQNGYSGGAAAFNLNQNSYTGGNLWLLSASTPTVWNNFAGNGFNLTFQANFADDAPSPSGVPEPGAFLLLGSGLLAVGAARCRASRKAPRTHA